MESRMWSGPHVTADTGHPINTPQDGPKPTLGKNKKFCQLYLLIGSEPLLVYVSQCLS